MHRLLLAALLLSAAPSVALASSSPWQQTEGARLRLVTTGVADAEGRLAGILEIQLKPGWKTYWRDPGDSGVPPSIDVSGSANIASVDVAYPAPDRFDDESGSWVGYKHAVAFPMTFRVAAPGQPVQIKADVFIGICEEICVPFQASLALDPVSDADNADDATAVQSAIATLPAPATAEFGATLASADDKRIVVGITAPGDPSTADLFLAGVDGYMFAAPKKDMAAGKLSFVATILDKPAVKPTSAGLPYTLVTEGGAVSGLLPFP